MKKLMKFRKTWTQVGLALLFAAGTVGLGGCDNHVELDVPPVYGPDPDLNVTFTGYSPTEGGVRTNMLINGSNFGSDPSLIDITIGGVETRAIRVIDNTIYCMVPARADGGSVEVTVWNADRTASVTHRFDQQFNYIYNTSVGTLCGVVDDLGNAAYQDGTFEEAGFTQPGLIYSDPWDDDVLYLFEQAASQLRRINIEEETVETLVSVASGWAQVNSIAWSITGDTMYVNNNQGNDAGPAMFMLTRADNFHTPRLVMRGRDCNCVFTNPVDGTLFCTIGTNAKLHRPQWNEATQMFDLGEPVASIGTNGQWFQSVQFVATGDYMMGTSRDNHYVFKAMYDWENQVPFNPLPFAGSGAGYGEGVGTTGSFFNQPRQGVFVYNPDYAEEGRAPEDCYDYYVAGSHNHCIHKVTPDAVVSTYAGRGSLGADGEVIGYIDGDLREDARFEYPEGICYIESRQTFYISDAGNHRIRTITIQ